MEKRAAEIIHNLYMNDRLEHAGEVVELRSIINNPEFCINRYRIEKDKLGKTQSSLYNPDNYDEFVKYVTENDIMSRMDIIVLLYDVLRLIMLTGDYRVRDIQRVIKEKAEYINRQKERIIIL